MQAIVLWSLVSLMAIALAMAPSAAALGQEKRAAQVSTPPKHPTSVTALMPQPRSVAYGDGWLHVKGGFQVEWLGYRNSLLDRAVLRFQNDVARRTGLDVGRASAAQLSTVGAKIRAL